MWGQEQEELGIGHKGVTPDGVFSLEEVEGIGVCCWAPAIQVNYEFHDDSGEYSSSAFDHPPTRW